jgi:hypothetical protein
MYTLYSIATIYEHILQPVLHVIQIIEVLLHFEALHVANCMDVVYI